MNTTTPSSSSTFLKRRASRTVVQQGESSSTSSSAASSVIMSGISGSGAMGGPHGKSGMGSSGGALTKNQHPNQNSRKKNRSPCREFFKNVGNYCAVSSWEVIIAFGVLYLSSFYVIQLPVDLSMASVSGGEDQESSGIFNSELVGFPMEHLFVYAAQILSIFHMIYRLRKAYLIRSSMIMWILLCYTFSMFTIFMVFMQRQQDVIWDSWHIVLYMLDIPRVSCLAHFVLCASHTAQISNIMAKGMSVLGPSFTSETIGKIMLIGVTYHTGVDFLVRVAWYNLVFNILNLVVFCSIYPACLFLYIETHQVNDEGELSHSRRANNCRSMVEKLRLFQENEARKNLKVFPIGVAGLALLHFGAFYWKYLRFVDIFSYGTAVLAVMITSCLYWAFTSLSAEAQLENQESLKSLTSFLNKQLDDIDLVTDDNYEETSSSRSDEAMLSSTDSTYGTDQKKAVNKAVRSPPEDSSSDWSDNSYKCNGGSRHQIQRLTTGTPVTDSRTAAEIFASASSSLQQPLNSASTAPLTKPGTGNAQSMITKENRPISECREILKTDPTSLTDDEVIQLLESKDIRGHCIETVLDNHLRGVEVRRKWLLKQSHMKHLKSLQDLQYTNYDYAKVMGACAESVIGVMTLPVGIVGPIPIKDGKDQDGHGFRDYHVPMATTEGCLVASTNRGCSALRQAGGVTTVLYQDAMSRAPILEFSSACHAALGKEWLDDKEKNFRKLKSEFESTSRFAKLIDIQPTIAGRKLYVRFVATTGDAMGMNMLSKATEHTLKELQNNPNFPEHNVVSLSGNLCTDKKPSAVNWIKGRGKGVVCEVIIPASVLEKTLKTSTEKLVKTNYDKNFVGSALAGSIGGNNAHAANIVTAIYIATGQDVAQVIESSNCMTQMEATGPEGRDLHMTVTMPSIEVGTVGGGTVLAAQGTCLDMLGVRGSQAGKPGVNARQLARIIAATVLAGELSLMSALTEGHLVKSHLRHNRSSATVPSLASDQATAAPPAASASGCTMTDSVSTQRQTSPKRS